MISYPRFRKELGIDADQEEGIVGLREEVLDLWDRVTGRPWRYAASRVDEFFNDDDCGVRTIWLHLWPVVSIASVEVKTGESDTDWTALTTLDWRLNGNREVRRISRYWELLVRVTYAAGYQDDQAPEDVLRALVVQARFLRARVGDKLTVRSENFEGGGGVFEEADLHPYFKATAARYRRVC